MKQNSVAKKTADGLRWVRGYKAHVLRDRKDRPVGRINRIGQPPMYVWGTAGLHGSDSGLRRAKRAVEEAVIKNIRQGDLFSGGDDAQ
jgi:hypothetical protein